MHRIAGWDSLLDHLAAAGARPRALGGDRVELTAAATGARLVLGRHEHAGATWLELVVVLGSARSLPVTNSLIDNANAAIGAFCLIGGELALRQTLPLAGLRVVDLERLLKAMAWRATQTRKQLGL